MRGFLSNECVKKMCPIYKIVILLLGTLLAWEQLQIDTDLLLIITSTGDRLFRIIDIDDLEPPKRGFK